ncbi:MAG: pilus assembly protein TadG-related protein [Actinomycetota bacterium]|nr:pilus assembly protein TadG-related protein [Actinomycetota bacterium]
MSRLRRVDPSAEAGLVGRSVVILLVVALVLGLAAVEGGSILFTQLKLQDAADAAASAASSAFGSSHQVPSAKQAALEAIQENDEGAHLVKLVIDTNGDVTVVLKKKAATMVVHRIGFLKHLGIVKATSTSGPPV